ncbi:MAG: hypothetical protein HOQ38_14245 [Nonomuraea sp.]|nr:hypothetical protein [Nonomuraea sp.]
MEDDHRVWPPGPRHRRTPPRDTRPDDSDDDFDDGFGDGFRGGFGGGRGGGLGGAEEPAWPPRLRRDPYERERPWNPRIRDASPPSDEPLPPSARFYGTPADPGIGRRVGGGAWRRLAGGLLAVLVGVGLFAGARTLIPRLTAPPPAQDRLNDPLAGVSLRLPPGWSVGPVAPVTGFTSVVRDGDGGMVMAGPVPGGAADPGKATAQAAELYSRLLLKGDKVTVVEDRAIPQGHTRALRAEYQDVVNRPAFLRVMLLTRAGRAVMLVGLLQPEGTGRRQALDAVMTSFR